MDLQCVSGHINETIFLFIKAMLNVDTMELSFITEAYTNNVSTLLNETDAFLQNVTFNLEVSLSCVYS